MKNTNWRRAAMIMALVIAGIAAFGVGYISGAGDAAQKLITIAVEVLEIEKIGAAELFHQYLKLKGG